MFFSSMAYTYFSKVVQSIILISQRMTIIHQNIPSMVITRSSVKQKEIILIWHLLSNDWIPANVLAYTFYAAIVWIYLHSNLLDGRVPKRNTCKTYNSIQWPCKIIQGHLFQYQSKTHVGPTCTAWETRRLKGWQSPIYVPTPLSF